MTETLGNNAESALKQFAERVMRLDEEAKALVGDRKHVLQEAAAAGFDEKVLKKVIKELQLPEAKRSKQLEFELVVDTYRKALGLPTNEDVIVGEARKRISEQGGQSMVERMVETAVERGDLTETEQPGVYEMPPGKKDKKSGSRATLQVVKD